MFRHQGICGNRTSCENRKHYVFCVTHVYTLDLMSLARRLAHSGRSLPLVAPIHLLPPHQLIRLAIGLIHPATGCRCCTAMSRKRLSLMPTILCYYWTAVELLTPHRLLFFLLQASAARNAMAVSNTPHGELLLSRTTLLSVCLLGNHLCLHLRQEETCGRKTRIPATSRPYPINHACGLTCYVGRCARLVRTRRILSGLAAGS